MDALIAITRVLTMTYLSAEMDYEMCPEFSPGVNQHRLDCDIEHILRDYSITKHQLVEFMYKSVPFEQLNELYDHVIYYYGHVKAPEGYESWHDLLYKQSLIEQQQLPPF